MRKREGKNPGTQALPAGLAAGLAARLAAVLATGLAAAPFVVAPLAAQQTSGAGPGSGASVDAAGLASGLASGPYSRMEMLLEKTIFQVDVLSLEIRFGPRTTARLEDLLAGAGAGSGTRGRQVADSIAAVALSADDVLATLEFRRNVGLKRFLDGIRASLRKAVAAGLVGEDDFETIAAALPRWYAFLAERGIRSGDRMRQRVRGDSLRTVYEGTGGEILLDQVDVGPERRLSVLGGYFAPGSDFRDGLIASLPGAD